MSETRVFWAAYFTACLFKVWLHQVYVVVL